MAALRSDRPGETPAAASDARVNIPILSMPQDGVPPLLPNSRP